MKRPEQGLGACFGALDRDGRPFVPDSYLVR